MIISKNNIKIAFSNTNDEKEMKFPYLLGEVKTMNRAMYSMFLGIMIDILLPKLEFPEDLVEVEPMITFMELNLINLKSKINLQEPVYIYFV